MSKKNKKERKFLKGFKEFISRGSVLDLAVGVIIATAFTKIVNSLVKDLLMPLIAAIFGESSFEGLYVVLRGSDPLSPAVISGIEKAGAVLYYGRFIQAIIDFLIIAFVIYVFIIVLIKGTQKRIQEMKEKEEEKKEEPVVIPADIQLLTQIRDSLNTIENQNKKIEFLQKELNDIKNAK